MANLKAPADIELMATCGTISVSKGSTESGASGKIQFEIIPESAIQVAPLLNKESFDLTFAQDGLGDGYSIAGLRLRPDADGAARAFVTFVAPESALPRLALLIAHSRVGTRAKLVLARHQTTLDDQLTRKADEPAGNCPFETCILPALHTGKHRLEQNEPQTLRAVN